MSRVQGAVALAIGAEEVQACCHRAIADLGWTMKLEQPGLLEAREDFTHLACCQSPAETRLEITESGAGCQLRVATKVPGFGPISSAHARGRHSAVVRSFYEQLSRSADVA